MARMDVGLRGENTMNHLEEFEEVLYTEKQVVEILMEKMNWTESQAWKFLNQCIADGTVTPLTAQ
jgi:hypothetical protein